MKAEQRKELETNALADRMGHLVKRAKTGSSRSTVLYVLAGIAVFATLFVVFRWFQTRNLETSDRWRKLEDGAHAKIEALIKEAGDTNAGKAAAFQKAWFFYWELGVKRLGGDSAGALKNMDFAAGIYKRLAEECADDPVWGPEALFGLAAIEENRAVQNPEKLDSAKRLYEDVATKHKDSAHGKRAAEWLKNYEDTDKRRELTQFYSDMRGQFPALPEFAPKGKGPMTLKDLGIDHP